MHGYFEARPVPTQNSVSTENGTALVQAFNIKNNRGICSTSIWDQVLKRWVPAGETPHHLISKLAVPTNVSVHTNCLYYSCAKIMEIYEYF